VGGLLSVSPTEEHHERRKFCRRGGNPRTCDSGSAIDSQGGLYLETNQLNALNYIFLYFSFTMAPTCFGKTMSSSGSDYVPV
jgi:hypothetical protein